MSLFSKQETTIQINEAEQVLVVGDYNDFTFSYYIYSEAFETWREQDLSYLKKFCSDSYDKLIKKIEKQLLKDGSQNESNNFSRG